MTVAQASRQPARASVLHLLLNVTETSAPYNEHALEPSPSTQVASCSFYSPVASDHNETTRFTHGGGSVVGFVRAARLIARRQKPDVVHAHSPHVAVLWLAACVGNMVRPRPVMILTVHTSFLNISNRNRLFLLISLPWFRRVVFCSKASRDSFPGLLLSILGKRAVVVSNGVALERLDRARARMPFPRRGHTSTFTVMAIGRLIPIKNPLAVIEAVARAQDPMIRLIFLGDGNLRRSLEQFAEAHGLQDRVEFRGIVARDEVYRTLASEADLYTSMSFIEGMPVAVLEALASGIPAILSDIPSHREIAEGMGDSVRLIGVGDIDALATAIRALIRCGSDYRRALGSRARGHIEQRFGLAAMQRGYAAVYEDAIRTPRRVRTG